MNQITDRGLSQEWIWLSEIIARTNKPVLTVVGNHDGLTKGKKIYPRMFGEYNYSFIFNRIKFIMWNNNKYEWGSPDFKWLRSELEADVKSVVVSHQPPYSGTLNSEEEALWLELRGASNYVLSLHGHVHNYKYRFEQSTQTGIYTVDRVNSLNKMEV